MDLRSQPRNVAPQRAQAAPQQESGAYAPEASTTSSSGGNFLQQSGLVTKIVAASIVLASLSVIGAMGLQAYNESKIAGASELRSVANDKYQAVFLTNGQVYFGKIKSISSEQLVLSDIYYLQQQAAQPENPANKDNKNVPANQQQNGGLSLAKLGNELHGPTDTMYISKDQVLFWENLKESKNSKVTEAIEEYKKTQKSE